MILDHALIISRGQHSGGGYIAGAGSGVLTVGSQTARRQVWLFDAQTLAIVDMVWSTVAGHYIFTGLSTAHRYVVMGRDNQGQYEPHAWDYVTPATDLTVAEQIALWESWQT